MERKPDWLPGFLVQIYCNRSFSMKTVKKLEALLEEYYETFKH